MGLTTKPTRTPTPKPTGDESLPWLNESGAATTTRPKPLERQAVSSEERDRISTSISQTWTDQAIKCHMTKADCLNCSIYRGNYSFECQMDKVVPILLENLGEPEPARVEKLMPFLYD